MTAQIFAIASSFLRWMAHFSSTAFSMVNVSVLVTDFLESSCVHSLIFGRRRTCRSGTGSHPSCRTSATPPFVRRTRSDLRASSSAAVPFDALLAAHVVRSRHDTRGLVAARVRTSRIADRWAKPVACKTELQLCRFDPRVRLAIQRTRHRLFVCALGIGDRDHRFVRE